MQDQLTVAGQPKPVLFSLMIDEHFLLAVEQFLGGNDTAGGRGGSLGFLDGMELRGMDFAGSHIWTVCYGGSDASDVQNGGSPLRNVRRRLHY